MSYLTLQIQQLQAIEKSNGTPEEIELLIKATNGETPWTEEMDDLMDKVLPE